jgi:heat shock protein HslJ
MKKIYALIILCFFIAGCTATNLNKTVNPPYEIEGMGWHLIDVIDADGNSIATVKTEGLSQSFLIVETDGWMRMSGEDGCNGFNGTYSIDGDNIRFIPPFSQTLRACTFEEGVFTDDDFQDALLNANRYEIDGDQLTLYTDDTRLIFIANPPPEMVPDYA